jgi:hypothetical protein
MTYRLDNLAQASNFNNIIMLVHMVHYNRCATSPAKLIPIEFHVNVLPCNQNSNIKFQYIPNWLFYIIFNIWIDTKNPLSKLQFSTRLHIYYTDDKNPCMP